MVCIHFFKKIEIEHDKIRDIRVSTVSENIFSYTHTHTYIYSHDVNFISFLGQTNLNDWIYFKFIIIFYFFLKNEVYSLPI